MTIIKALQATTPAMPCIARRAWFFPGSTATDESWRVYPMNGTPCRVKKTGRYHWDRPWSPTAEELLADDWVTVVAHESR